MALRTRSVIKAATKTADTIPRGVTIESRTPWTPNTQQRTTQHKRALSHPTGKEDRLEATNTQTPQARDHRQEQVNMKSPGKRETRKRASRRSGASRLKQAEQDQPARLTKEPDPLKNVPQTHLGTTKPPLDAGGTARYQDGSGNRKTLLLSRTHQPTLLKQSIVPSKEGSRRSCT